MHRGMLESVPLPSSGRCPTDWQNQDLSQCCATSSWLIANSPTDQGYRRKESATGYSASGGCCDVVCLVLSDIDVTRIGKWLGGVGR